MIVTNDCIQRVGDEDIRFLIIDCDTIKEAEYAEKEALRKGWLNYMGGIATNEKTNLPSLVMYKNL